ncbi:MAG: hypothetical protein RLZZ387_1917 [Chloroflexota bacterium]|jgi:hypothetical protein
MVATTPNEITPRRLLARLQLGAVIPALLLAALMLWCVFRSVADAGWAAGLDILIPVALLGLVAGALFARMGWMPAWLAHPLAAALGVTLAVQRAGPALVAQVEREFGPLAAERLASWPDQATEILIRAVIWGRILAAGGRGEDIVLFVVVLALLAWTLGYTTSWLLFRARRPWLAVALSGVVILINYTFAFPKPDLLFFLFLGAALLLLVLQQIAEQQDLWRAVHMEFPDFLPARFVAAAAVFCVLVVLGTALLPGNVSSDEAARAWRAIRQPFTAAREAWNDAFSTINAPPGTGGSFTLRGVGVGGPRQLGEDEVMRVRSDRYEYWRAVAFDRYAGRQWQSTVGERARAALGVATAEQARSPLAAGQALNQEELDARELVTQTVALVQPRNDGLITFGGQLSSVSLPSLVQHGYTTVGGELVPNFTETASVVADVSLDQTRSYTVTSFFSTVDEQSLRRAGATYPAWVRAPYLQLPETLPARVRELAQQIAVDSGADNPYDKALAVQAYLRALPYDETRPAPPEGRDWADYFLFEGRRGYCDDFATAMVVLLRAQDVPARWVQGYAGGVLDPDDGAYVVRENVAHSWVEVYFPGYGWQRFEPTPAPYASVPLRPAEAAPEEGAEPRPTSDLPMNDPNELRRLEEELRQGAGGGDLEAARRELEARRMAERLALLGTVAGVIAALAALAAAVWLTLEWRLRGLSPAQAAFARMERMASWAGLPQPPEATPYEYGETLKRELRAARAPVDQIVEAYVAEQYAPAGRSQPDAARLERSLGDLRPSLLRRIAARAGEVILPRRRP